MAFPPFFCNLLSAVSCRKSLTRLDRLFDSNFIVPLISDSSYMWDREFLVLEVEMIYLHVYVGRFERFCLKLIVLPPTICLNVLLIGKTPREIMDHSFTF